MKNKERVYSICCILLIIDQLVKLLIKNNMKLLDEIIVIPNFFSIYYIENKGAAFSMLGGATILLILVSLLAIIILDRYISKEKKMTKLSIIALGMVMGGIFGNLIDRIIYKVVIDYLSFNIFGYNFPVFNIADIGITVGVVLLVVDIIRRDYCEVRSKKSRRFKNR